MLDAVLGASLAGKADTNADVYSSDVAIWRLSRPWKSNPVIRRLASKSNSRQALAPVQI